MKVFNIFTVAMAVVSFVQNASAKTCSEWKEDANGNVSCCAFSETCSDKGLLDACPSGKTCISENSCYRLAKCEDITKYKYQNTLKDVTLFSFDGAKRNKGNTNNKYTKITDILTSLGGPRVDFYFSNGDYATAFTPNTNYSISVNGEKCYISVNTSGCDTGLVVQNNNDGTYILVSVKDKDILDDVYGYCIDNESMLVQGDHLAPYVVYNHSDINTSRVDHYGNTTFLPNLLQMNRINKQLSSINSVFDYPIPEGKNARLWYSQQVDCFWTRPINTDGTTDPRESYLLYTFNSSVTDKSRSIDKYNEDNEEGYWASAYINNYGYGQRCNSQGYIDNSISHGDYVPMFDKDILGGILKSCSSSLQCRYLPLIKLKN